MFLLDLPGRMNLCYFKMCVKMFKQMQRQHKFTINHKFLVFYEKCLLAHSACRQDYIGSCALAGTDLQACDVNFRPSIFFTV